ncbi:hypothetical protein JVU11DRAFT_4285 [Chiua virens]|nr:hypothetical protein JVU11DRAFT_4285 [Chiua virens]
MTCHWVGCSTRLKKGSLLRHIRETHLEREFLVCPKCPQRFTRDHTRRIHLSRKHGGN